MQTYAKIIQSVCNFCDSAAESFSFKRLTVGLVSSHGKMFTSYRRNVAKWTKTWNRTDGEYFCEAVSMDDAQVTEYWTRIPKEMPRGSHEKGPDMIMGDGEPSKKPSSAKKATCAAESKAKKKPAATANFAKAPKKEAAKEAKTMKKAMEQTLD